MSPGKASKGKAKEKSKEKPKEKSKEKSAEEWAAIRPRFTELYMGGGDGKQGMALEKVVDILAAEGFVASARQYKRKVLEWGLGKNIPGSAMRTIFETEGPPRPDENRDYVLPDGTVVPRHKVLRWWRAYRKRHVGTYDENIPTDMTPYLPDFYMYDPNEQSVGGSSSAASNPSGTVPDYAIATSAWGSPYAMTTTAGPVDASVAAMYGHGAADPASYQYADPSAYGAHGIAYPDNSVAGYAGDSGVGYPDNSGGGYPNNSAAGYPSNSGVEYPADSGPGYTENAGDEYSGDSGAGGSGMYGDHSGNY